MVGGQVRVRKQYIEVWVDERERKEI